MVVFTSWWHGNGIIPNGYAPTLAQWQAGLEQSISSITSPGTKKVVWGDIPYLAQAGPDCLAAHQSDVQACSTPASQAVLTDHEQTLKAAAQATGATSLQQHRGSPRRSARLLSVSTACTPMLTISLVRTPYLQGAIAAALQPVMG